MSTLAEIEAAVEALPAAQKQELLLFIVAQLKGKREPIPEPRVFSQGQVNDWLAEDEADMKRFTGT